ncbi:MAG: lamin tail domain-containing protein [Candidatus Paceibacterota bacterium]
MTQAKTFKFILLFVAAALIFPPIIFAQTEEEAMLQNNDYPRLSQLDTQKILKNSLPKALTEKWCSSFKAFDQDRFYMAVPLTLRSFINYNFFHYLLSDVPLDTAKIITIQGIEIGKIILTGDFQSAFVGMIEKFEKESVAAAIKYIKSELFKNEIKLSVGAFEAKYYSEEKEDKEKALIQYIIVYKEKENSQADISIRLYSTEPINPPSPKGSIGLATGVYHSLKPGEQIPPFVVTVSGVIQKNQDGGVFYSWAERPQIDISFPSDVLDLGLRPKSWWERNVVDPIKNFFQSSIKGFEDIFGAQLVPTITDLTEEEAQEEILSSEVSKINGLQSLTEINRDTTATNEGENATNRDTIATIDDKSRQEEKQISVNATIEEKIRDITATEETETATNRDTTATQPQSIATQSRQLTLEEQKQAINDIIRELMRRQQDQEQTEEQKESLKQGLVSIVQELAKRNGQISQDSGGNNTDEDRDNNDDSDRDNNDDNNEDRDNNDDSDRDNDDSDSSIATSYCDYQSSQMPQSNRVIINEIAWMGTEDSATHEWIELKNLTSQTIDLEGWQIQDKDRQIKIVFDSGSQILPGEFLLLERTDDDSVPHISADLIYKGSLSNANEALYLFGPDCSLQDKAEAAPSWPAGSSTPKKTMERSGNLSWHTYSGSGQNGIMGTPRAENSLGAAVYSGGGGSSSSQQQSQNENENENTESPNSEPDQQIQQNISEPDAVNHLIISEVQLGNESSQEYVELYNPTSEDVSLCPNSSEESSNYYFSYYPLGREWNDPYRSKSFCESTEGENAFISAGGYYLISFGGWPEEESDWPMYSSGILSDSSGSMAVFLGNPKNATGTAEEVMEQVNIMKADALGWKETESAEDPTIKESAAAIAPEEAGSVLGRLWHNASEKYQDTDNNAQDFAAQDPSPKDSLSFAPEAIGDLSVQSCPDQKNAVKLSWFAPYDPDTPSEQLDYIIFFVRNQDPKEENFEEIEAGLAITKQGEEAVAVITDLYYDSSYYFSVQAVDGEDNISPLSGASPVFSIAAANHPWPMAKHDAGLTNKGDFAGPDGEETAGAFASLSGDFRSPPVIDENGAVYFFGKVDGQNGLYAFDAAGQKKWSLEISNSYQIPALSPDGTIYFFSSFGVGAASPSGKIKWSENFSAIYTGNPLVGADSRLYLIAKTDSQSVPHLLALSDNGNQAVKDIDYDLAQEIGQGDSFFSAAGPVLDNAGNIYLAVNQKLIKLNSFGQKILERVFEPEYAEEYEGEKNKTVSIGAPFVFNGGNAVIAIVGGGYCFKEIGENSENDICRPMVYSVSFSDLNSENWKKPISISTDWIEPMGREIYYAKRTPSNLTGGFLDLYAVDLATGNNSWKKHWYGKWSMPKMYPVLTDGQDRAYFAQESTVLGLDITQIFDEDPSNGLVFNASATDYSSNSNGGALGPAGLYIPALNQLSLIP